MQADTFAILAALALVALVLGALALRRPAPVAAAAPDPALAAQVAALGTAVATLRVELAAESARHAGEIAQKHQALATDQTRALNDLLREAHRAVAEGFERADRSHLAWCAEQREAGLKAQAALTDALRAETAAMVALLKAQEKMIGDGHAAQDSARLRWEGDHRHLSGRAQAAVVETLTREVGALRSLMEAKAKETREEIEARLTAMRESNDARLADIQRGVNEQLAGAVERQMNESFNRVIDQFTAIQQMMGGVQAVASQVGDLKRLFSNVKSRGGWGEGQVRALLEDILPPGSWQTNVRLREDSLDAVEFAVDMPAQGGRRASLAVDSKFPTEDYERLLAAHEAGDAEAERAARAALERRIRDEAAKIASKYICPPRTAEFAVLYLPSDGLYAEIARVPGLTDDIGRVHRVFVLGPALLPAMLRTIQLGHVSLALSANAEGVRDLLAATKAEMAKMDVVLDRLGKQVGTVTNTIGDARVRTRAIARKLKGVEVLAAPGASEVLLEIPAGSGATLLLEDEET